MAVSWAHTLVARFLSLSFTPPHTFSLTFTPLHPVSLTRSSPSLRRGFIMGIWNAHTSVGNILGTVIPSFWANTPSSPWGLSFFVPALIIATMGVIAFLFLVPGRRGEGGGRGKGDVSDVSVL